MISTEDGRETLKLADFGLARTYQASHLSGLTIEGGLGGTALFMPPEQILNFRYVQPSADQYAAAATLYHLLTNKYLTNTAAPCRNCSKLLLNDPVPIRTRRPDVPPASPTWSTRRWRGGRRIATPT